MALWAIKLLSKIGIGYDYTSPTSLIFSLAALVPQHKGDQIIPICLGLNCESALKA